MGAGTLVLASLLWTATALPPDTIAMKVKAIEIPIQYNPERRQSIKELLLFVSTDQGRTWTQEARAKPTDQNFSFYAPQDGIYWFAVCTINQQGQRDPADVNQLPASLKILVDTQPPIVQLKSAERVGDDIAVSWSIQEANPSPDTMKLEYRAADSPTALWTAVPLTPGPTGEIKFRVSGTEAYLVRLSIQDTAGNQGQAMKKVGGETTSAFGPAATSPTAPPPSIPVIPPSAPPAHTSTGIVPAMPDPVPGVPGPGPIPRIEPPPVRVDSAPILERSPAPATMNPIARSGRGEATMRDGYGPSARDGVASGASGGPLASSNTNPSTHHENRNTQLINSTQISLSYNISQYGPSGVSSAKLYITDNEGATWSFLTEDRTVNSRLHTSNPAEGRITATLPGEGTFGFRLVVESGAGLSRGAPVNGVDQPEMRVEVDLTAPEVNLFGPVPDPSKRDTLIMRWTVTDKNLSATPITLEWSETENGPWKRIAGDLPNTGTYCWRLAQRMPPRVYLRITARDLAGNISEARTDKPELIDLTRPEGHLIGIVSARVQVQP